MLCNRAFLYSKFSSIFLIISSLSAHYQLIICGKANFKIINYNDRKFDVY